MGIEVILVYARIPQRIACRAICVFGLLRHENSLGTGQFLLQVRHYKLGSKG